MLKVSEIWKFNGIDFGIEWYLDHARVSVLHGMKIEKQNESDLD